MKCPKCGYVRKSTDSAPEWECPACGIAYAKFGTSPHGHSATYTTDHAGTSDSPTTLIESPVQPGLGQPQPTSSSGEEPVQFRPFANLDNLTMFALLGFFAGLLVAYLTWDSGEQGPSVFFLAPLLGVSVTGGGGLVALLYMNLRKATLSGTLTDGWGQVYVAMQIGGWVVAALAVAYKSGWL